MQITIGDIGAIAGVLIYRPEFAGHRYRKPHIIAIGYLLFAIVMASYLWAWMARENRRRDRLEEDTNLKEVNEADDEKQRLYLGDRDRRYRYQL